MFFKMIKGALFRKKTNMLIIFVTIALGSSLATAMLNVMLDVGDKVNKELKTYGANINVVPKDAALLSELYGVEEGSGVEDKYLQESELGNIKTIFWANNIVDFAPFLNAEVSVNSSEKNVPFIGTWFMKTLDLPTGETVNTGVIPLKSWWSIEGEWPADDETNAVVVGSICAEKLGIKVNDTITIATPDGMSDEVLVKGIFTSGGIEDEAIYAPLDYVQSLTGKEGLVSRIEVSALTTPENELSERAAQDPSALSIKDWETWYCTAYTSSIAYQIEEVITDSHAKPVLQVAESEGVILQKTQLLMVLITILSLICSALAISNLVTASVIERRQEIALFKAIGASNKKIVGLILTEIMIIAIFGGIAGYFLGLGFAQIIGYTVFGSATTIKGIVIPLVAVLVALVTVVGSLPALSTILSLKPAEVLHDR